MTYTVFAIRFELASYAILIALHIKIYALYDATNIANMMPQKYHNLD